MKKIASALDNLQKVGGVAGYNPDETDLPTLIGGIIGAFLGFLGTIFVVLMIYAGFLYMTAQGNEDQVEKAKGIIKNAIIGIAITMMAYAISNFVIGAIAG